MKFKGTRGEWHTYYAVMGGEDQIHILSERGGRSLAIIPKHNKEDEANAHLIAAAPELLEALQRVFVHAKVMINENHPDYKYTEQAINKALNK